MLTRGTNYRLLLKEEVEEYYVQSTTISIKEYFLAKDGLNEDIKILFHKNTIGANSFIGQI